MGLLFLKKVFRCLHTGWVFQYIGKCFNCSESNEFFCPMGGKDTFIPESAIYKQMKFIYSFGSTDNTSYFSIPNSLTTSFNKVSLTTNNKWPLNVFSSSLSVYCREKPLPFISNFPTSSISIHSTDEVNVNVMIGIGFVKGLLIKCISANADHIFLNGKGRLTGHLKK